MSVQETPDHEGSPAEIVVFAHYFGGSGRSWWPLADALGASFDCRTPDLGGFAGAEISRSGPSLEAYADQLEELSSQPYVLVGHSMGAKLALAVAARRPALLRALVLINASPPWPEPMSAEDRDRLLRAYGDPAALRAQLRESTFAPLPAELEEQEAQAAVRAHSRAWTWWLEDGSRTDITAAVAGLTLPVLVLAGDQDANLPGELAREIAALWPRASFSAVAGAGHLAPLERPAEVAAEIRRFLSELPAAQPVAGRERAAAAASAIEAGPPPVFSETHADGDAAPMICFSHLRWDFVVQRPQHLMWRFARERRVYVWEEPVAAVPQAGHHLAVRDDEATGVTVVTPRLAEGLSPEETEAELARLLAAFAAERGVGAPVLWYYTPMMLAFSRVLADQASAVVYDCMDELSAFAFAPPRLKELEQELMAAADVVFTGGWSLYEAKRGRRVDIHPFPSSVDREHFAQGRAPQPAPPDQVVLPEPRLGFYGVIDERMDLDLVAALAEAHPEWSIVMVGPIVKIDAATLPRRGNLHYLGAKTYSQLPAYLAGWDVALMPFALNAATRFISPTKTPEYLAGGRPVVSTAIADVKRHYGALEAVVVADTHAEFIAGCEAAVSLVRHDAGASWLKAVDALLTNLSWDVTQARMTALLEAAIATRVQRELHPAPTHLVALTAVLPARRRSHYDVVVVGAGFAGTVMAERLARASGQRVLVIDRRPHIAGNAFDVHDDAGVLIHQYGPHIFHTNSDEIVRHLSRFTAWRTYEHRVLGSVDGKLVPIPINRTTLNALYGLDLRSDEQAAAFLASRAEPVEKIRTSEDVVVSAVGRELYEKFFQGYTRKQWGVDPSELDRSVTSRVPTRTNTNDRYFTDSFQAMPKQGFTHMFQNMLDHDNITVSTGVEFEDVQADVLFDRLVFTGPVDEFFGHRFGRLPYRSLRFEHQTHDVEQFQPVAVVNYPSPDIPYTRVSEYKHLTGQKHPKTSITYEHPAAEGDPYYPIPRPENQALYKRYEELALGRPDVAFVGRLATYRYYNMDQVVGQALAAWRRLQSREARVSTREVEASARA